MFTEEQLTGMMFEVVDWRQSKRFITSWDNFPEKCMLVVTEIDEFYNISYSAKEEDRSEELADIFIRLLDIKGSLMEGSDYTESNIFRQVISYPRVGDWGYLFLGGLPYNLMRIIHEISMAVEAHRNPNKQGHEILHYIDNAIGAVIRISEFCYYDLPEAYRAKMDKNKKRPHMHGKNY